MRARGTLLAAALLAGSAAALAGTAAPAPAATPPMGWNPWNAFHTEVDEAKILAVADKLASSGLRDAGYRYVNMDDGWWRTRRADGRIEVRTSMFPSGALADGSTSMRRFVDALHARGLRAGIYTDIGRNACSQAWDRHSPNLPEGTQAAREIGTFGHQAADMRLLFGEWRFDYVKVDACGLADFGAEQPWVSDGTHRAVEPWIVLGRPDAAGAARVEALYAGLKGALHAVRPEDDYVLSICAWGEARVGNWAGKYGNLWRTSADIEPTWTSMLHNFDSAAARALYAGPGGWNDPDMLELGHGEFDAGHLVEARSHLSLWAIAAAPLILGADLTRMPQALLDIAGKREVIAVDQDPAGHQGVTVMRDGDVQVLARTLAAAGRKAVAVVNRGDRARRVTLPLARLHMASGATARDLWTGAERRLDGALTVALAPRETALLLLSGAAAEPGTVYLSEVPARIRVLEDGGAALPTLLAASWIPAQVNAAPSGRPLALAGVRADDGLGVLAGSRLALRLDGEFARFRGRVGVNDGGMAARDGLAWRILGDGKPLSEGRGKVPADVDVDVRGVRTLELVSGEAGGLPVEVAWAGARLQH
ncbi:NPCBM/NEW2 domain-containing protein [Massilia sp. TN1-12]|uniref:NPCBM/NEW2 domain-containing protein n=1 Tax=Massilia paldalensis TaxID=3377675 RepID=UPI00384C866A